MNAICKIQVHCANCRNRDAVVWRRLAAERGLIPREAVDGECPYGRKWGEDGDLELPDTKSRLPLGDWVASALKAVGIRPTKRCGCEHRRKALNRIGEQLVQAITKRR